MKAGKWFVISIHHYFQFVLNFFVFFFEIPMILFPSQIFIVKINLNNSSFLPYLPPIWGKIWFTKSQPFFLN